MKFCTTCNENILNCKCRRGPTAFPEPDAPRPERKQHNPDNLTPGQIALIPGLRLLDEDESRVDRPMPPLPQIFCWRNGIGWVPGYSGRSECYTSATTLTRAELRAARGLPTELTEDQIDANIEALGDGSLRACDTAQLDARAREVIADAPKADPLAPEPAAESATPRTHELKTDPIVFDDVAEGKKTFELRKDDRGFEVGDVLLLRKTKHTGQEMQSGMPLEYVDNPIERTITHILRGPIYGLEAGWVILSITKRTDIFREALRARVSQLETELAAAQSEIERMTKERDELTEANLRLGNFVNDEYDKVLLIAENAQLRARVATLEARLGAPRGAQEAATDSQGASASSQPHEPAGANADSERTA